jgi:hypothetical protein
MDALAGPVLADHVDLLERAILANELSLALHRGHGLVEVVEALVRDLGAVPDYQAISGHGLILAI